MFDFHDLNFYVTISIIKLYQGNCGYIMCFEIWLQFVIVKVLNRTRFKWYSQTWANYHLRVATTCQQRQPFKGPILNFYFYKWPLNNNYLSTTATILRSRGWSLSTGLTIYEFFKCLKKYFARFTLINSKKFAKKIDPIF